MSAISAHGASSAFNRDGKFISFAGYRFIHRARLNVLALNGSPECRNNGKNNKCRRCGYDMETLAHVLCHCPPALGKGITARHNAIQNRLVRAIRGRPRDQRNQTLFVNQNITIAHRNVRPDLVLINDRTKKVAIVDVTCPFENGPEAFAVARQQKITKYDAEATAYRLRGYTVHQGAIVVGSLGTWDPENASSLQALGIPNRYACKMTRFIVSETIDYSKNLFWQHILGDKYQYGMKN